MSLLIDALRKAERAKRQDETANPVTTAGTDLTLEPVIADESQAARSPATTSMPERTAPTRRPELPELENQETAERRAILNTFAVKESAKTDKKVALLAATAGLLAVGGIGGYLWWQLRPFPPPLTPKTVPAPVAPVRTAPTPSPAASDVPPSVRDTSVATATVSASPTQPAKVTQRPPATPEERRATVTPKQMTSAGMLAPINVTAPQLKPDATLAEAFDAFQAGNLAVARAAYEKLLQADPRSSEALHGLAAIALREGRADVAAVAYLRILDANPSDAAAHAGLVGLDTRSDPVASESRIKSLLAAQPDMPVLNFALGNLYARQGRWDEAQQAYFKAVTGDGNSPDYLFNLAVSLDQLHQPSLAAQYYGRALMAAANRPAAFDRAQASSRLRQLQP